LRKEENVGYKEEYSEGLNNLNFKTRSLEEPQLNNEEVNSRSHQSRSYNLPKSAVYIGAFAFYIIGIIMMSSNSNIPNGIGLLYGTPYVVIGLILNFVGILIGTNSSNKFGKYLLEFGGFLLFVSLIPIIGAIIFIGVGGW
jgi:hypothetical protein